MEPVTNITQRNTVGITDSDRTQPLAPKFSSLSGGFKKLSPVLEKADIETQKVKLRKASKDFEGILVKEILKSMRSTLTDGGMFGTGTAGKIYSDMMDDAVANKIAERGDIGFADIIYKQMVKSIDPNEYKKTPVQSENTVKGMAEK
ncbi:rod-binding protein [Candidatus Latescibacterota bacterium]